MDIEGRQVLHSCDTPPCVIPAHLRPDLNAENGKDMTDRGRQGKGSHKPASKMTEDQVRGVKAAIQLGWRHKDIAAKLGVSRSCITMIAVGRTWKHVTHPAPPVVAQMAENLLET
ncbi:hypothetical protein OVA06_12925 [Pseudarthrobacter sp. SL88]|uniref:hypothetical protein n=1 Tax=Pseudarthrobacter sp. SL88 TaxID=2994666 RepID=UPI00227593A0|nr:hypothetical protein [Pseudarthrobacter sp. SL88]MCY1675598.1 hypothetical protein [Pseudarthrobacter sp. SL88]